MDRLFKNKNKNKNYGSVNLINISDNYINLITTVNKNSTIQYLKQTICDFYVNIPLTNIEIYDPIDKVNLDNNYIISNYQDYFNTCDYLQPILNTCCYKQPIILDLEYRIIKLPS